MGLVVHSAGIQDRVGACEVIDKIKGKYENLQKILADSAYSGRAQIYCHIQLGALMSVIKKSDLKKFVVIPKRWVVERTLAWLNNYRRLSKDYERTISSSTNFVLIADIRRMLKRLCQIRSKKRTPT